MRLLLLGHFLIKLFIKKQSLTLALEFLVLDFTQLYINS